MHFEYFRGHWCHYFSEPLLHHPHQTQSDFSLLQPPTAASWPFLCSLEKMVSLSFLKPPSRSFKTAMKPLLSVLQAEKIYLLSVSPQTSAAPVPWPLLKILSACRNLILKSPHQVGLVLQVGYNNAIQSGIPHPSAFLLLSRQHSQCMVSL